MAFSLLVGGFQSVAMASSPLEVAPVSIRKDYPGGSWIEVDCSSKEEGCKILGEMKGRAFKYSGSAIEGLGELRPDSVRMFTESVAPGQIAIEVEVECNESEADHRLKRAVCLKSALLDQDGIFMMDSRVVDVLDEQ
ncbi:MAG: hypothetical protein KDI56_02835 [Xanthomonadales bacterium]|nr:hypothetical protein [Xanthomonadales bacterium]